VTRILRLPPAAALGTRSVMRRPAQTLMTAGSIVIAVATATAALAVQATFIAQAQPGSAAADNALVALANQAANNRLRALVYLFAVMFVILGAINLLFVAAFSARDTRHNHAVLRAIGFTPSQSVRSLVTTQLVTAAPATLAGIPIGLLLFHAVYAASANGQSDTGPANPPAIWFAGLVLIVTATIGLLSAAPAAALAQHTIAPALTTD
jgi:FtsX-like permease family